MTTLVNSAPATGTGTVTIAAPVTNSTQTATLPDATGNVVLDSATQTLTNKTLGSGSTLGASLLVSGTAQATTSGTAIDFTGIPSWAKRITMMFVGVSTNGLSNHRVQLGTGGTPTTSGYGSVGTRVYSTVTASASSGGFDIPYDGAAFTSGGLLTFAKQSGNTWVCSGIVSSTTSTVMSIQVSGSVPLSGILDMVRLTTVNGTDTFDAGSVNILYE